MYNEYDFLTSRHEITLEGLTCLLKSINQSMFSLFFLFFFIPNPHFFLWDEIWKLIPILFIFLKKNYFYQGSHHHHHHHQVVQIRGSLNKFQTFFVWALLLIVHIWNSSPILGNLLWLQCTCTVPTTSGRSHGSPLVWTCQWLSSQPLSSPQLSHNDSLWA